MDDLSIIGSWHLKRFQMESVNGEISFPWGEKPVGYMHIGDEGFLHINIMQEGRGDLLGKLQADYSPIESVSALNSYFSVVGTYEVDGQSITINILASSNQGLVGKTRVNTIATSVNTLTMCLDGDDFTKDNVKLQLDWNPT